MSRCVIWAKRHGSYYSLQQSNSVFNTDYVGSPPAHMHTDIQRPLAVVSYTRYILIIMAVKLTMKQKIRSIIYEIVQRSSMKRQEN